MTFAPPSPKPGWRRWLAAASLSLWFASPTAHAADAAAWPRKTIRFVVPFPPDGSVDNTARRLAPTVGFDVERDLVPITRIMRSPFVVVVHPSVPAQTIGELVTLLKAQPDRCHFASVGPGSSNHPTGGLFKATSGASIKQVPYRGGVNETPDGWVTARVDQRAGRPMPSLSVSATARRTA